MIAAFHTLGCKTNAYETQAVIRQFREAGYEIREFSDRCDVYVINTCAVTQEAARKSRQMSRRCKRQNPSAVVVVTGCYAQEAKEALLEDGSADIVVGNSEKSEILSLVKAYCAGRDPDAEKEGVPESGRDGGILQVRDLTHWTEYERQLITGQEDHVRAYVKIQDGCNRFCSYCLIPYLRGRSRSRSGADILHEVQLLASKGYQEVVLTGIDISTFRWTEEQASEEDLKNGEDLAVLMERIARIPGIRRIRLGSLEAGVASESMIRRLRETAAFCPQFHLSLQSGSDTVLKRMNRHYTTAQFAETAAMIREYFPGAAITTDVITGFPGETEKEFEETCTFVQKMAFSRMHVFPFSRRPGTRADQMPDQLTKAVKEERARELIRVGEKLRLQYEGTLIGKPCEILTEEVVFLPEKNPGGKQACYLAGYTPEYVKIYANAGLLAGHPVTDVSEAQNLINWFPEVVPSRFADGILIAEKEQI